MSRKIFKIINYIFGHHTLSNSDHCLIINISGNPVHICSRCLGLYPFAFLALFVFLKFNIRFSGSWEKNLILYLILPVYIDWALTSLRIIKSNNLIRFSTGLIASFGLARWWFIYLKGIHLEVFYYVTKIYLIAIGCILIFLIFRDRHSDI